MLDCSGVFAACYQPVMYLPSAAIDICTWYRSEVRSSILWASTICGTRRFKRPMKQIDSLFRKVPAALLVAIQAGLIAVRVVCLSQGDTVGSETFLYLIWLAAFVFLIKLLVGIVCGYRRWEYTFLLLALLSFVASGVLGKQTVGQVTFIIFLGSILGLLLVRLGRRYGYGAAQR
jgi:hypothetical protein